MDVTRQPFGITRRTALRGALGLTFVAGSGPILLGCGSATGSGGAGSVGAARQTTGLIVESSNLFVADAKGFFEANGVGGDLKGFVIANDGAQSMLAGGADTATIVELPTLRYVAGGADLVSVAVILTAKNLKLVGAGMDSPQDMVGKRIAYPFSTGQDYGFAAYLEMLGMQRDDVEHVNAENADLTPLLTRGDIDGFIGVEPQVGQALEAAEGATLLTPGPAEAYQARHNLVVQRSWAEENPAVVEGILQALIDANEFIRSDPDESAQIVATQLRTEPQTVKDLWEANEDDFTVYLDDSVVTAFDDVKSWMQGLDALERDVVVEDVINPQYLRAVDESAVRI